MAIGDGYGWGSFAVYGPAGTGPACVGQPKRARYGRTHMAARTGLVWQSGLGQTSSLLVPRRMVRLSWRMVRLSRRMVCLRPWSERRPGRLLSPLVITRPNDLLAKQ